MNAIPSPALSTLEAVLNQLTDETTQRVMQALAEDGLASVTKWLTTKEAAEHLRVAPQRLYNLKQSGDLVPTGANGSRNLYEQSELDRWARENAGSSELADAIS